jgi:uncharacterized membrane protein
VLLVTKKTKLKERKMKNRKQITLYTTRGALIAALYVVITELATLVGLSSGAIQFRISEALCILPIFMPEAIPGLFIGCFISNMLVPQVAIWDIIFGSLATLIGAIGARALMKLPEKFKWVCTIPTILANMIIVPFVLIYAYGAPDSYPFLMMTVGIGEIVCAGIGGSALYYILKKQENQLFNFN